MTDRAARPPRAFTVRGWRNGSPVHVTWTEGGLLSGDPPTVDMLYVQADIVRLLHRDGIGARAFPELVRETSEDPLSKPESAHRLILQVLDSVRESTGDVPDGTGGRGIESGAAERQGTPPTPPADAV